MRIGDLIINMKSIILCLLFVQVAFGSGNLLGGWNDVDLSANDEGSMFSQAVNEVVEHIKNIQNTLSTIRLIRVVRAKQQVHIKSIVFVVLYFSF